jgi:anion-transporting  ArsA/GET3 family ATPase
MIVSTQFNSWKDKQILFVSGKGGVGKSLVAAGLARELAKAGKRVLLAEIGETSYYKDFWNLPSIGHEPSRHPDGFDVALWSGETSLREYVLFYLKMERLYSLFFENKVMRSLVNVAPGLSEIAILGKITSGIRKVGPPLEYDTIIVDSFATGHALALLQAPKGMMEAIKFGPMGHHSREMDQVIKNPKLTGYIVVTLLEELPVTESLEFSATLKRELGVGVDIVANKVLQAPVEAKEIKAIANDPESPDLKDFARYLEGVDERQTKYMKVLEESGVPVTRIPLIFSSEPQTLVKETGEALRKP